MALEQKVQDKAIYEVLLEGTLPAISRIRIEAKSEFEAGLLAERIAASQRQGVKTTALEIEAYPADFLVVEGVSEITPVDSDGLGKIWNRDEIEMLLGETEARTSASAPTARSV